MYLHCVHCTYWSLGDSLKPGGHVNTFVVSLFCYSLFHKANGHPDVSKRHYFFSNIAVSFFLFIQEWFILLLSPFFKIDTFIIIYYVRIIFSRIVMKLMKYSPAHSKDPRRQAQLKLKYGSIYLSLFYMLMFELLFIVLVFLIS